MIESSKEPEDEISEVQTQTQFPDLDLFFEDYQGFAIDNDSYGGFDILDYVENGYFEPLDDFELSWSDSFIPTGYSLLKHTHVSSFDQVFYNPQLVILILTILLFSALLIKVLKFIKKRKITSQFQTVPTPELKNPNDHEQYIESIHSLDYDRSYAFETAFESFGPTISDVEYDKPSLSELFNISGAPSLNYGTDSLHEEQVSKKETTDVIQLNNDYPDALISSTIVMGDDSFEKFMTRFETEDSQVIPLTIDKYSDSNPSYSIPVNRAASREFNQTIDELVNRRKLIDLLPSSQGSSLEINHEPHSLSSRNYPVNMTLLSDEITAVWGDGDELENEKGHDEYQLTDDIERINQAEPSDNFAETVFQMDLGSSESEYKTQQSEAFSNIVESYVRSIKHIKELNEYLEGFTPDNSSVDEKIDFFEILSGKEQASTIATSLTEEDSMGPELGSSYEKSTDVIQKDSSKAKDTVDIENEVLKEIILPNELSLPRKQSILKAVFESSPASKNELFSSPSSKIPILNNDRVERIIRSPRPEFHSQQKSKITDEVLKHFFSTEEPDIEGYLVELFGEDPKVSINTDLLETLSRENIDTLIDVYVGKEFSENWKERYENFDLLIGHLRLHEPKQLYSYFEEKIFDVIEDILEMVGTSRSKLLEKVILFSREIVYYGDSFTLNDESFVSLIHLLIPLTKSTSKFIYKLALKSLCLMIQAVGIQDFKRIFNLMSSDILGNRKLKGEKYACLFMIKFYLAANYKDMTGDDSAEIVKKLLPFTSNLAIDSFQKTRAEIVEIYLILERKIPQSPNLVLFYDSFSTFLKSKLEKPQIPKNEVNIADN